MKPNDIYAQLELIPTDFDRSKAVNDLYAQLEFMPADLEASKTADVSKLARIWRQAVTGLGQIGHSLLNYFCGSMEPRILTKRDRQGDVYFVAYDPVSNQRCTFNSEGALRSWLDQRYYH